MFCNQCGQKNVNDAKFCSDCGNKLESVNIQSSSAIQLQKETPPLRKNRLSFGILMRRQTGVCCLVQHLALIFI